MFFSLRDVYLHCSNFCAQCLDHGTFAHLCASFRTFTTMCSNYSANTCSNNTYREPFYVSNPPQYTFLVVFFDIPYG